MFINRYLIRFAHGSEKYLLRACGYELLVTVLGTLISLCTAFTVQMLLGQSQVLFFDNVYTLFALMGAGFVIRYFLSQKKVISANKCGVVIKSNLRERLLAKLYELGPAFLTESRTGSVASTVSDKVEGLSYYYSLYLPVAVSTLLNGVCLLVILAVLDWVTALVCFAAFVGMLGCPMAFYRLMEERGKKEWEVHSSYYADCLDSIQGMVTLKALNANEERRKYIHAEGDKMRLCIMEQLRVTMLENGVLEFLARLGGAFSVAVAVVHTIWAGAETEKLLYIFFLVGACFSPMQNLANAWHMGYRGVTASYSIMDLLEKDALLSLWKREDGAFGSQPEGAMGIKATNTGKAQADLEDTDSRRKTVILPDIQFRDVSFAYNKEDGDVLHHVSFTVPAGTMTALVGTSGSGKSTIAHLLAGFYPAQEGTISVGPLVMGEKNVGSVQKMIAAVWQDSHIFCGSVKDNIRMGREDASEEEIISAAKSANIHDFIVSLPDGYDTVLGENGLRFSGGERQRISLARASLKDAPILLFDEATSSLDRKNEIDIQRSFARLSYGKTSLVIAHRLSTIRQADQICIVEHGRIVERGTHDELADSSAVYRALMGGQIQ